MALPKTHRLRRRQDFERVYRRGKRYHASALLLRVFFERRTQPPKPVRIAVVVSQKVHKRAVVRNRIRRQIQASLQTLLSHLPHGLLIVITVKSTALECDYHQFLRELKQLLADAEVLDGDS